MSDVIFTTHPIKNFQFGPWVFVNSTLTLSPEKAEEFRNAINTLPEYERIKIREINQEAALALVEKHKAAKQGVQTTADSGRAALQKLKMANPEVKEEQ